MKEKYIYGGKPADVKDASGVSGVIIKLYGGGYAFRVYEKDHSYTDYEINHDDLPVTIDQDSLSAFYTNDKISSLDHSPEVFGLKKYNLKPVK